MLRTYKTVTAKDHNDRGGISRIQFLKEMDEVLGDRPLISNMHTVGIGVVTTRNVEPNSPEVMLQMIIIKRR